MENQEAYINQILQSRKEHEHALIQSSRNWLSLSGLFLLHEGDNRVNSSPHGIFIEGFPADAEIIINGAKGRASLVQATAGVLLNDKPAQPQFLIADVDGEADVLAAGSLLMIVIQRGSQLYLRVWNLDAQTLKDFHGLNYYPVNPAFCLPAEYIPFDIPREKIIRDAIGGETSKPFPGFVRFRFMGSNYELIAEEIEEQFLLNFTDLTRQDTTYPGGRFMVIDKPEQNEMTLDFNLARNWPCAYTPYATCPLPPVENHLMLRIEAGEMRYHD